MPRSAPYSDSPTLPDRLGTELLSVRERRLAARIDLWCWAARRIATTISFIVVSVLAVGHLI